MINRILPGRMSIITLLVIVASLCPGLSGDLLQSQDLHFSHFYHTPLSVNPAFTGRFEADFRVGGNYRNQWQSISRPYRTFSAWGDHNFFNDPRNRQFTGVGVGALLFRDRAGDGRLTTTKLFVNAAGHLGLGEDEEFRISVGVGLGFVQKSLDFERLIFDDQWTVDGFDKDVSTLEPGNDRPLNYPDVQAGFLLGYKPDDQMEFFLGMNMVHPTRPAETFYSSENRVGLRPVITAGGVIQLKNDMFLEPSLIYMRQKKAQEFIIGATFGKPLDHYLEPTLLFGLWTRATGDLIPSAGLIYNNIRGMITYDFNLYHVNQASKGFGGIELSVIYMWEREDRRTEVVIPCLRY